MLFAPTAASGAFPLTQADHPSGVVINEIHSQGGPFDWIELLNTSSATVDLSSWSFTDDDLDREYAVIADGTVLEPGEYLVICTLPVGGFEAAQDGPGDPHANHGMIATLTVA